MKRIFITVLIICLGVSAAFGGDRYLPEEPEVKDVTIRFNGDYLKGEYLLLDARSSDEKNRDRERKKLSGKVIVFFHGHSQRPDDGLDLIKEITLNSKSGISVIPVCDTPWGKDEKFRGDDGKDVILMEMVRNALYTKNINVEGSKPLTAKEIDIEPFVFKATNDMLVDAKLVSAGWSHGGILARRFASRYPGAVTDLVQMATAGFIQWGGKSCAGPSCLQASFNWESMRIGMGIFRGEAKYVFGSGWGIVKGVVGDTARSCPSFLYGNSNCLKFFRNYRDLQGCALYVTDENFPVPHLDHIAILLGYDDSLFNPGEVVKAKDVKKPTQRELEAFWANFYPSAVSRGVKLKLAVYEGNHIGPIVYHKKYAKTALKSIGELK